MEELPTELLFDIIEKIDILDINKICNCNKHFKKFCKKNRLQIMKTFLVKHKKFIKSETENQIITSFKILYARIKAYNYYKEKFPYILVDISNKFHDSLLPMKPEIIKKYTIGAAKLLYHKYTKYEFEAIKESVYKRLTLDGAKHIINKIIYRYQHIPLSNPFIKEY